MLNPTINKYVQTAETLDKRQANHLFWSPNGRFIVLGGLRSMSGVLEFVDTYDMTIMAQAEHFMATGNIVTPYGQRDVMQIILNLYQKKSRFISCYCFLIL